MHHRIPLFLSMRLFQMLFEGLSFVKTLVTLVITYATDLPLQNMTKIVCLLSLCFDIFNNKTLWTTLNYVTQFFSPYQGSFPHAETKKVTLNFFFSFLTQVVTYYLTEVKIQKNLSVKNLAKAVLKRSDTGNSQLVTVYLQGCVASKRYSARVFKSSRYLNPNIKESL